jgi:Tol biopolymer transport system component
MFRFALRVLLRLLPIILVLILFQRLVPVQTQKPSGWVAFTRPSSNTGIISHTLHLLNIETGVVQSVRSFKHSNPGNPTWSQDGILAYEAWLGDYYGITLIDVNSGLSVDLTDQWISQRHAVWSLDDKLAFEASHGHGQSFIVIFDLAIGRYMSVGLGNSPTWTPDNNLTYRDRLNYDRIILYDLENHIHHSIIEHDETIWQMAWSPNGETLAYLTDHNGNYVLNLYHRYRSPTHRESFPYEFIGWSPGGQLAFSSSLNNRSSILLYETVDGSISTAAQLDMLITQAKWVSETHLMFSSNHTGNYDIYLLDLTDDSLTNLTNSPQDELNAAWMP